MSHAVAPFKQRLRDALESDSLPTALGRVLPLLDGRRREAFHGRDFPAEQARLAAIRKRDVADGPRLLQQFTATAEKAGMVVHPPDDAAAVRATVAELLRKASVRMVVKSKSMATEGDRPAAGARSRRAGSDRDRLGRVPGASGGRAALAHRRAGAAHHPRARRRADRQRHRTRIAPGPGHARGGGARVSARQVHRRRRRHHGRQCAGGQHRQRDAGEQRGQCAAVQQPAAAAHRRRGRRQARRHHDRRRGHAGHAAGKRHGTDHVQLRLVHQRSESQRGHRDVAVARRPRPARRAHRPARQRPRGHAARSGLSNRAAVRALRGLLEHLPGLSAGRRTRHGPHLQRTRLACCSPRSITEWRTWPGRRRCAPAAAPAPPCVRPEYRFRSLSRKCARAPSPAAPPATA